MTTALETSFRADEAYARSLDAADPLRAYRERFHMPVTMRGDEVIYFCGNSLGLQPTTARAMIEEELDAWAKLGVDAHFKAKTPWFPYHEVFRECGARLVGAKPGEVVMMNSLTANLHLLMVSFYRPEGSRTKILMESPAFPSDTYAIRTHVRTRGLNPDEHIIIMAPRAGEHTIREEDIESLIVEQGENIALILLGGVNFFTGQVFDLERITALGHSQGCIVGFDLAHAAGNVPLRLHEWRVDFAAWCSYKYLNAGPGAVAGAFIHEKHAKNTSLSELPRYGGWWGNDPRKRFRMHLEPEFEPVPSAEAWQLSNPPILAMAPLRASLAIFDEVGMDALRNKSRQLTGYLRWLIEREGSERDFEIITPRDDAATGCQLSFLVHHHPKDRFRALEAAGVIGDFREPNVIRVAPVPLYNSFHDVWRFAQLLA
ncbi:MAG TPA: kynureninase [Phycisphaerales bacterium]|nr:kynureninase [Phycisphaerales bacterium]HRQ76891.1 kynureninase [Phycisphaerales bacterium]